MLRCEFNVSFKLWDYLVSNHEAQADTILIDVSGALYESKKFEKFLLILERDTDSCVNDWNLKTLLHYRNFDRYWALFCEL